MCSFSQSRSHGIVEVWTTESTKLVRGSGEADENATTTFTPMLFGLKILRNTMLLFFICFLLKLHCTPRNLQSLYSAICTSSDEVSRRSHALSCQQKFVQQFALGNFDALFSPGCFFDKNVSFLLCLEKSLSFIITWNKYINYTKFLLTLFANCGGLVIKAHFSMCINVSLSKMWMCDSGDRKCKRFYLGLGLTAFFWETSASSRAFIFFFPSGVLRYHF